MRPFVRPRTTMPAPWTSTFIPGISGETLTIFSLSNVFMSTGLEKLMLNGVSGGHDGLPFRDHRSHVWCVTSIAPYVLNENDCSLSVVRGPSALGAPALMRTNALVATGSGFTGRNASQRPFSACCERRRAVSFASISSASASLIGTAPFLVASSTKPSIAFGSIA